MMMKKLLLGTAAFVCIASNVFAGSIDYLSNQSPDYVRTFSRNAADDYADAVHYNPAGTVLLKDGLSLQVGNQTIFKDYSDTLSANGTSKKFSTSEPTPVLPTLWGVYKKDNMAGFIGFSAIGGGGQVNYNDGVPLMVQQASTVAAGVAQAKGIPASYVTASFGDGSLYVNQYDPSMVIGGSYALNKYVSVSLSGRAVYVYRKYSGDADYNLTVGTTAASTTLKLDATETAFGVGGIVGVDVRPADQLNIGLRFETPVYLNLKTDVSNGKNFGGLFVDGKKRRKDLPAVLAAGVSYRVAGFTFTSSIDTFFISLSDQSKDDATKGIYNNGYDDNFSKVGYEVSGSIEYAIIPDFLKVSTGYMYDKVGGNSKTYNDFDFSLDSHSIGAGAKVKLAESLEVTLSGARVFYISGKNATGTVTYKKDAYMLSGGIDYHL